MKGEEEEGEEEGLTCYEEKDQREKGGR